jgi:hypothetical protein
MFKIKFEKMVEAFFPKSYFDRLKGCPVLKWRRKTQRLGKVKKLYQFLTD